MIHREGSNSSVENLGEEDPNVPQDVQCSKRSKFPYPTDDDGSACSEISDGTMQRYGLKFDCKPDISEISAMTHGVNYGDLALASNEAMKRRPSLVKPTASDADDGAEITWSQLLDHEAQAKPPSTCNISSTKTYAWSKGYDESLDAGGEAMSPSPFALDSIISRSQRSVKSGAGAMSLPTLSSRRRPLRALKRFISRRKSSNATTIPQSVFVDHGKKEGTRQQLQGYS